MIFVNFILNIVLLMFIATFYALLAVRYYVYCYLYMFWAGYPIFHNGVQVSIVASEAKDSLDSKNEGSFFMELWQERGQQTFGTGSNCLRESCLPQHFGTCVLKKIV
ncbi:titin-like [Platysternon megacephalum]|uniref:Titin-like n=1 Tax=Platysternon megacephalum TaxID=55544 RepID=A0A4D9DQT2_9SAUR|nr:titin-like [Platysternon megacephalum]